MTARTLAFVREIPVYGVCSLDILAAAAIDAGFDEFSVATDARRKEVYLASYAGGRRVSGPEVVKPAVAKTEAAWSDEAACSTRRRSRTPSGRSTRRPRSCATWWSTGASRSSTRTALPAPPRRRRAWEAQAGQLTRGRANGPTYISAVFTTTTTMKATAKRPAGRGNPRPRRHRGRAPSSPVAAGRSGSAHVARRTAPTGQRPPPAERQRAYPNDRRPVDRAPAHASSSSTAISTRNATTSFALTSSPGAAAAHNGSLSLRFRAAVGRTSRYAGVLGVARPLHHACSPAAGRRWRRPGSRSSRAERARSPAPAASPPARPPASQIPHHTQASPK